MTCAIDTFNWRTDTADLFILHSGLAHHLRSHCTANSSSLCTASLLTRLSATSCSTQTSLRHSHTYTTKLIESYCLSLMWFAAMDTVDNSKRMAQSGQMLLTDGSSTLTTLKGGNTASSGMSGILSSLTSQNSSTPATSGLGGLFGSLSSLTGAPSTGTGSTSTGTGSILSTISQLFPLSGSTTDVYSFLTQENLPGEAKSPPSKHMCLHSYLWLASMKQELIRKLSKEHWTHESPTIKLQDFIILVEHVYLLLYFMSMDSLSNPNQYCSCSSGRSLWIWKLTSIFETTDHPDRFAIAWRFMQMLMADINAMSFAVLAYKIFSYHLVSVSALAMQGLHVTQGIRRTLFSTDWTQHDIAELAPILKQLNVGSLLGVVDSSQDGLLQLLSALSRLTGMSSGNKKDILYICGLLTSTERYWWSTKFKSHTVFWEWLAWIDRPPSPNVMLNLERSQFSLGSSLIIQSKTAAQCFVIMEESLPNKDPQHLRVEN